MNFVFEWQEQYLKNECSERVRYCSCHEHEIHILVLTCSVLLYENTYDGVFDDFPKISDNSLKISETSPKLVRRSQERRRTFSKSTFLNITEDFRRLPRDFRRRPEDVSVIHKLGISEIIDIFATENMENTPPEFWTWSRLNFTSLYNKGPTFLMFDVFELMKYCLSLRDMFILITSLGDYLTNYHCLCTQNHLYLNKKTSQNVNIKR